MPAMVADYAMGVKPAQEVVCQAAAGVQAGRPVGIYPKTRAPAVDKWHCAALLPSPCNVHTPVYCCHWSTMHIAALQRQEVPPGVKSTHQGQMTTVIWEMICDSFAN